jgi:cell division protein FtsL
MNRFFLSNAGLALLILCALTLALLSLWERHEMIRTGYEIERINREKKLLERAHQQLLAERESLSNLGRIERIAAERLGMVRSKPESQRLLEER